MLSQRSRWAAIPRGIARPTFPAADRVVTQPSLPAQYRTAFTALRTALKTYRQAPPGLARAAALRELQDAFSAAEGLVRSHQLKTRQEAAGVGALRTGAVYLDSTDKARLAEAGGILEDS